MIGLGDYSEGDVDLGAMGKENVVWVRFGAHGGLCHG